MAYTVIHKKSNVVNNGVPKLPTSGDVVYGEIAVNYGASGETLSIKNSNNEIVPFSSDNAINAAFEVHAKALTDLDRRILELKDGKFDADSFDEFLDELNAKLSVASQSLGDLHKAIVNLEDKVKLNEIVISEALCDLNNRINAK